MRVFTDGACTKNGKADALAGYACWFPEHKEWSIAERVPSNESQTNNRAELYAILRAMETLRDKGYEDADVVIYTDSQYGIDCLTKWCLKWMKNGWKTNTGDVLNKDIIERALDVLSRFKSYRFHHVRAHTGGSDDLSVQNHIVDRMAVATIEPVREIVPPAVDQLFPECPLQLMGPPVAQAELTRWIRTHLDVLDTETIDKYLVKAFTELCKERDVVLTKQTIQKRPMVRAERAHLQINHVVVHKQDE